MKKQIVVTVNGEQHTDEVEPRLLLVHYLRDDLRLTGTHVGCETSLCGACTVMLNGQAVKSCTVLAVQADGGEVLTVEGLEKDGQVASPPGRLLGRAWPSVWLLHARDANGLLPIVTAQSESH